MANQDPEPKILTTNHDFSVPATNGTSNIATIYTNQANNEDVRIHGFAIDIVPLDAAGNQLKTETVTNPYYYNSVAPNTSPFGTFTDFDVEILVGGNRIPTNDISIQRLVMPGDANQRYITFTSPVLILFQQPLQVSVSNNAAIAAHDMVNAGTDVATVRVKVTLIGELEIQKTVY